MTSRTIRTLLVDDEPLARQGLRVRLSRESDVEIAGEAEDGPSAVDAIFALKPDLVFLDIQMPGFDGFDVLAKTASEHLPAVVFVTAYDRYALRAFAVHALDYLLKPLTHRRFQDSMRRARTALDQSAAAESAERLRALLDAHESSSAAAAITVASPPAAPDTDYAVRFTVRDGERFVLLRVRDIDWIEAAANYLKLHAGTKAYQLRMTMADVERRLEPAQFGRIHRSAIVNLDRVASIDPEWHGEYQVVLTTGTRLRLSRSYRDRLLQRDDPGH